MNYLTDEVKDKAKKLRQDLPTLSVYESLKIAVDLQRNELYAKANVIAPDNEYPGALESIAINLGETAKIGERPLI